MCSCLAQTARVPKNQSRQSQVQEAAVCLTYADNKWIFGSATLAVALWSLCTAISCVQTGHGANREEDNATQPPDFSQARRIAQVNSCQCCRGIFDDHVFGCQITKIIETSSDARIMTGFSSSVVKREVSTIHQHNHCASHTVSKVGKTKALSRQTAECQARAGPGFMVDTLPSTS